MKAQGLDNELAYLRKRMHEMAHEKSDDRHEVDERRYKALALIVKSVIAQHRLDPARANDLGEHISALLRSVGEEMLPLQEDA
jgi:hypothetical protein